MDWLIQKIGNGLEDRCRPQFTNSLSILVRTFLRTNVGVQVEFIIFVFCPLIFHWPLAGLPCLGTFYSVNIIVT